MKPLDAITVRRWYWLAAGAVGVGLVLGAWCYLAVVGYRANLRVEQWDLAVPGTLDLALADDAYFVWYRPGRVAADRPPNSAPTPPAGLRLVVRSLASEGRPAAPPAGGNAGAPPPNAEVPNLLSAPLPATSPAGTAFILGQYRLVAGRYEFRADGVPGPLLLTVVRQPPRPGTWIQAATYGTTFFPLAGIATAWMIVRYVRQRRQEEQDLAALLTPPGETAGR